ncbi:MAG: translocation/assembly module TamB domain-containing protein [Oligoflexia bacterium]|nr:translocation/assembly module TamB domain-containing protein [Oligoflexia bacterium]
MKKKLFMRLLKAGFAALFLTAAFVVAALLVLLRWPGLFLGERTLPWLAERLHGATGVVLTWRHGTLDVESLSFLDKRVTLAFTGLCARQEAQHACFSTASLEARMDFSGLKFRLVDVGPIQLIGGSVDVQLPPSEAAPSTPSPSEKGPSIDVPARLLNSRLLPVLIQIDEARVRDGEELYRGAVTLRVADDPDGKPTGSLLAEATLPDLEQVELRSDFRVRTEPAPPRRLRRDREALVFLEHRLSGSYSDSSDRIRLSAQGTAGENRLHERMDWQWEGLERTRGRHPRWTARLGGESCELDFDSSATRIRCPLRAPLPVPPKALPRGHVPARIRGTLTARLNPMSFPPDLSRPITGDAELKLDPILTPLLEGGGTVRSRISGVLTEFPRNWKLDTTFGFELAIPRFERLVRQLRKTAWAVPAPFHVLEGAIRLNASGKTQVFDGILPLSLQTRLASSNQRLDLDAEATLELADLQRLGSPPGRQAGEAPGAPEARLRARVKLSEVRLELPRLKLEAPPPLLPDPRIRGTRWFEGQRASGQKSETVAFEYDIEVLTPEGQPVKLISNLAKDPVPLQLRLRLSDSAPLQGQLSVGSVPLRVLRRRALLESFDLRLATPVDDSPLSGRIRVTYADYVLKILLLGTAGAPRIRLTSDPPLPEEQLTAVLLFGRPLEELDPDQSASVADARSALADGALNLASLYVLASTPIQSVGYNPNSREFTLKFRLGAGTSLNIGSVSGEYQEIGIRKRLGPHWTITTDLRHRTLEPAAADSVDSTRGKASAFLEWHNRY